MGLVGRLISFVSGVRNGIGFKESQIDPGGGANITAEHFSDPGDDSHPLPGDFVSAVDIPRAGGSVATGYIDAKNTPKAAAGEKRIYGRDSDGVIVNEIHLFNTGKLIVKNDKGTMTLEPDGKWTVESPVAILDIHIDGRIHGRNASSGSFLLQADGRFGGSNINGFFRLDVNGDFNANGTLTKPNGDIIGLTKVTADSMIVNSKELAEHDHDAGTPPGLTGVNNP